MRSEKEIRDRLERTKEYIKKRRGYAPMEYTYIQLTLEWVLGLRDK